MIIRFLCLLLLLCLPSVAHANHSVVWGQTLVNQIGIAGTAGFGVGVCPAPPAGFSTIAGTLVKGSDNYGNYQFQDGSIMVWVPKFYYKVGTGANGLAVNVIDVKGAGTYPTTAAANAAGYALHRAFIDGGTEQSGFFVDKYKCSANTWGTGTIASSIQNGNPLSAHADHNPLTGLTACSANNYSETIKAAKARDGVDGAQNAASRFFVASRFIRSALAMLSMAHGQAATSTTNCAWYDGTGTTNFPKGCNNDALRDTNDTSVIWQSDGYSNCGKTGSAGYGGGAGNLFAKSTHNGQNCGVADLNGLVWEVSLGITATATTKTISGATQADPCVLTLDNTTGLTNGQVVQVYSVVGMTQINDKFYTVTVIDGTTVSLDGVNSSAYTAYASAGTLAAYGGFYTAKEATRMRDFTSSNTAATDHWGATGIAAMMDAFSPAFVVAAGGSTTAQRYGSGANQVLSEATSGAGWLLSGLGLPATVNGLSTSGTNLFGQDYYYQYLRNELCLLSGGSWSNNVSAGVWYAYWHHDRANSNDYVGFRSACYLD